MSGSSSFDESGSENFNLDVPLFSLFVSYKQSKSSKYSNRVDSNFETQSQYFEQNKGEAYINQAKCIVSRVEIEKNAQAQFWEGFVNGLRQLLLATKEPNDEKRRQIRVEFIKNYGTHYFSKESMYKTNKRLRFCDRLISFT